MEIVNHNFPLTDRMEYGERVHDLDDLIKGAAAGMRGVGPGQKENLEESADSNFYLGERAAFVMDEYTPPGGEERIPDSSGLF